MATEFITKRPHKKSRGGCKSCKIRKIKCDEAQPICTFCEKRDITCSYLPRATRSYPSSPTRSQEIFNPSSPSSPDQEYFENASSTWSMVQSPQPKVVTSSGNLTPLHLRAMHFWSLFTSQTISPGSQAFTVLQVTVPQLAFENEYLLNVILGISSLHMQSILPDAEQSRKDTDVYRAKALSGFRQALSNINAFKTPTWEAALMTSILLNVLCSKNYLVDDGNLAVIHWLSLYRGLSSVISLRSFPEVMDSRVAPIFRRSINELQTEPMVPLTLSKMLDDTCPFDPDYEYLEYYRKTLDLLGILYASLRQDGLNLGFRTRVLSWCSFISQDFTNLAKQRRPRSLILLAHFMVFVKTMTTVWWVDGVADQDIRQIMKMLPPRWFPLVEVPRQALAITDAEELKFLLLNSVDENYSPVMKTSAEEYTVAIRWFRKEPYTPEEQLDLQSIQ